MKVLVNAYAVAPHLGSEPGMGWNWCSRLAEFHELYIITEGEFRLQIEQALENFPFRDNMHFYYLPVSDRVRKMCWNQGDWRFYIHYRRWQKRALQLGRQLVEEEKIDLIHQLNMVGFREPGYLWRIKGPRYIWGPIGGMAITSLKFFRESPLRERLRVFLKNQLNRIQAHGYRVRRAARRAETVFAATPDEQRVVSAFPGCHVVQINETAAESFPRITPHASDRDDVFELLWVGRMIESKQLALALRILSRLDAGIRLRVVGGGEKAQVIRYQRLAESLGVQDRVIWEGLVQKTEVQRLMQDADVFLFTSVREATSTVVLEAISNCLPVVCFNICGFGPLVDDTIGRKVTLTDPERAVEDFAAVIDDLYHHRETLAELSRNCLQRREELSWERKMEKVLTYYRPGHSGR